MFHCRAGMGDEQAVQLQELNSRLSAYLSRVRQLEQENQLLVEEIESLQVGREAEWKHGYEVEITQLRTQLEELTVQKSRAEMERESLWQEFQQLKLLCGEVQAIRSSIEKELTRHRNDLKKAEDGCRMLEEVLLRLQAEHQELVLVCEKEVAHLRGGVLGLTIEWVREEKPYRATSLSLQEIEEYAIEVSESWKETFQQYQRKVDELEEWVRVSTQNLEGAEEEKRQHLLELEELRWQVEELERMRLSLEEELRAMREKFMLEVHEYQVVIESLEDEKQSLALSISERLKDYHELMQTKTDLSMEVATYRALLEGEHNKGMFKWTEEQIRKMQQGFETSTHEHITNYSQQQRQNARRFVPAIHTSVDTRNKMHLPLDRSSGPWLRPGPFTTGSATTVRKDVLVTGHQPSTSVRDEVTYQSSMQNYNGRTHPWHHDNYRPSLPMGRVATFTTQESTSNLHTSSTDAPRPGISQITKPKVEIFTKFPGYDHSWEFRETKTMQGEGQGVSTEKKKVHEYSKLLSTNLPKEEMKSVKVTKTEKTGAVGEKPFREEKGYVFEIQTKESAVSERGNTRQEGFITIDVPIKVNRTANVQEKNERENQIQKEMTFMMNTQAKQDVTQEGLRTIEIPVQLISTRQTQEKTTVIDKSRGERSFIVNEEDNKFSVARSGSEEQIMGLKTQKDETSSINQEIVTEKTTADKLAKPSSQNLPKEETKSVKVITVEKNISVGEKPSRAETNYVFEIRSKDTAMSERVKTRHEELINPDVPIKVIEMGKVQEKDESENQAQSEMNCMVRTQVKLEGEEVAQKEVEAIEIPIKLIGTRETQQTMKVIDNTLGERNFIVNEEAKNYSADVSEAEVRTMGWESGKDQTSSINQVISNEKLKEYEISKPFSQNLSKEETKSIKVTTVEKRFALGEKPFREETNYVFEIRPKDSTVSERVNTRHEESISIDVPIKVIGTGKVGETNERENQTQREMNFLVNTEVKLEGEDVTQEGLRTIEIPIHLLGTRETQGKTIVIDKTRGERSFIVNEEVKEQLAAELEEQTRECESRKDHTSSINQEISTEKAKVYEYSKPSGQYLPEEKTNSVKVATVEKTIALGEKPSRAETSYVFEIGLKDTTVSERVETKHEEPITINIPINVIGMGKVQEKKEIEIDTQNEMNFMVHMQEKLEGEDAAQERLRAIEIPIQLIGARETQEKAKIMDDTRVERSFIVNKEFKEYSLDVSDSSVQSEERTRGWDSHKDQTSPINQEMASENLNRHDHTPVVFEVHSIEQMSQGSNIAISVRSTDGIQADEDSGNVAETKELYAAETKSSSNTVEDEGVKQSPKRAATWSEEFAEHVKTADILREFGYSTGLEMSDGASHDAKVTYSETKQRADNGTVTTEITMQSTTEEDFNLSDEEEIEQLLNSSLEKTTLKHLKGMQAESFLENILHGGMKGKMGVRVEITEEPMELTTDEQSDFSVPFQVEEADDGASGFMGNYGTDEEAAHCSMAAHGLEDQRKAREETTHVEDVTDGGDTGEDLEYIVSTPDDFPMPSGEHHDLLYGHVHIEEESNIRYSWQDDFLKSSQHKKTFSDFPKHGSTTEVCHGDRDDAFNDSVEEKTQQTKASHAERFVIEKEIKVQPELQATILSLLSKEIKDPKHQLKGALEQLEESLPGILKEELSALSTEDQQDSNDFAVDIKKVEQTNNDGVVTIVAEINVSKTIDVDNLDVLNYFEGNPNIIEEALLHSSKDNVSENLKSYKEIDIAGKAIEIQVPTAGTSSMLWSSEEIYSSSKINTNKDLPSSMAEESPKERPDSEQSKPILTGETTQTSPDINTFVRHVKLDPKDVKTIEHVIFEGPVSETRELGTADKQSPAEGSTDVTRSVRHFKVGATEIRTTQEFICEGPSSELAEFGEEVHPTEESTDASRVIRHIKLGPREAYSSEQIIFEGPISDLSPTEGAVANNRFIRHIQLGAKEFQTEQQIIFKGPVSESPEGSDKGDSSKTSSNIATKHFKLSPTESQMMEHIIFHGPLTHSTEHVSTETISEGGSSTSIRHFSLGSKTQGTEQIIFEGPISEASAESSTQVRHIKISPTDLKSSGQIIFEGPISDSLQTELTTSTRHIKIKTRDIEATKEVTSEHQGLEQHVPSVVEIPHASDSADVNRPITLIKLGPTEKSFTFQVDVSQSSTDPLGEGGSQHTKMIFSTSTLTEDPSATKPEMANEDEEKHIKEANGQSASAEIMPDEYEEYFRSNGQEVIDTSMFDRTIQLQRMVDQRSLISDDKKIAVVYLDHQEEF